MPRRPGWWKVQSSRPTFDPYELGARRSDPQLAALDPIPDTPPRIRTSTILLALVVGIAFVVLSRGTASKHDNGPAVTGSCTQPAVALDRTSTRRYGALSWSAWAPEGSSIVIALDSTSLPAPGTAARLAGPVRLAGCRGHGRFGLPADVGKHELTFFAVTPSGAATTIGSKPMTVSPS